MSAAVITRVAVVPHPPLLVPQLVAGNDYQAQAVRSACLSVAARLAEDTPNWLAIGADATGPALLGPRSAGTFLGYGVDVVVRLGSDDCAEGEPDPMMPLPALVAGWLRGQVGAESVTVRLIPPDLPTERCRAMGETLRGDEPVGLLLLGDGSHRHGERSVGRPDDRAAAFDERVRAALATADQAALLALDSELAAELGALGRAPWQVLAGLPGEWRCAGSDLFTPYGVAYHVALWERA